MHSREHLATSLVAGLALVQFVETPLGPVGTVAFAGLLGVVVDLDHFLIARFRTGSWGPLRRAVTSPRRAFIDQDELFDAGDVGERTRLLSHVLVASLLVAGFLVTWPSLAIVVAVVLSVHIGADLLWDALRARDEASGNGQEGSRTDG